MVGDIGAAIIRFLVWIFKKTGINGILIIVLLIEMPLLFAFLSDSAQHYIIEDNYRIQNIVDYEEISIENLPEKEKEYAADSNRYFYVDVQIDNYYYKEMGIPDLDAEDSEGNFLAFSRCGYYDDLKETYGSSLYSVIPSGTSAYASYLLTVPDYRMDTLDFITVYSFLDHINYDSAEKEIEAGRRISVLFE